MKADRIIHLHSKMIEGGNITPSEVVKIKKIIKTNPDDLESRLLLLGYYRPFMGRNSAKASQFSNHFEWLIDNHPSDEFVFGALLYTEKNKFYLSAKRHWKKAIKSAPEDLQILLNAVHSVRIADPRFAETLLRHAQLSEPENECWSSELAHLYSWQCSDPDLAMDRRNCKRAMAQARESLQLHRRNPRASYLQTYMQSEVLGWANLALTFGQLEDAEYFGQFLIELATSGITIKDEDGEKHSYNNLLHSGHSILGRVAVARRDIEGAEKILYEMPNLEFGLSLDLLLADELLKLNVTDAVVSYLKACDNTLTSAIQYYLKGHHSRVPYFFKIMHAHNCPELKMHDFLTTRLKSKQEKIGVWIQMIENGENPNFKMHRSISL